MKTVETDEEGDVLCRCVLRPPPTAQAPSALRERVFTVRKMDLRVNPEHASALGRYEQRGRRDGAEATRKRKQRG